MPADAAIPAELAAFLHGDVDNVTFHHEDHLRVAFHILKRHDFAEAAAAFSLALKRLARHAGHPGAYHETITIAFLSLIAERIASAHYECFETFVSENADLLDKTFLSRWYTPDRLHSAIARRTFILPEPRS